MPATTPAPGATEDQVFDPLAELRKRYPGVAQEPDEKLYQHLSNPANFRSAFPEYEHLDDQTITTNMAKHAPTEQARQGVVTPPGIAPMKAQTETQFEKEREGATPTLTGGSSKTGGGVLSNWWDAITNILKPSSVSPYPGMDTEAKQAAAQGAKEQDVARQEAGRSGAYRAGAVLASPFVNAPAMEHAADVGNKRAIVGQALGSSTVAAAPLIAEGAGRVAKPITRAITESKPAQIVGDIASTGKRGLTEPLGIGVPGERMVKQGVSPYAKQLGFDKALETAGNDVLAYHKETPIKTVQDLHDAWPEIKNKIMQEEIQPVAKEHAAEELSQERWARIDKAVTDSVHPFQTKIEGGGVPAAAQEVLDKIHNAKTIGDVIGVEKGDRGGALGWLNGQLESYFKKYPSARGNDLMKNPDTAALEGARRALREEALDHLEEEGENGIRGARQRWGAADELNRATERRINQADRLKPIGIGKAMGLAFAPKTAGLSYVLGAIGDWLNKPDTLVGRGMEKMAKAAGEKPIDVAPTPARPITKQIAPAERTLTTGPGGPPPRVPEAFRMEPTGSVADETKLGTRGQGGTIGERKLLPAPKTPAGTTKPTPIPAEPAPTPAKPWTTESREPEAKPAATAQRPAIEQEFTPEEILDAEGLIKSELGMMDSGDKPGRYFDEWREGAPTAGNRSVKQGERMGGVWRGVKSMRPMLTFMKEWTGTPSALQRAMDRGSGPTYTQAIRFAADMIQRQKAKAPAGMTQSTIFRAHDVGNPEVDLGAHAHATASREEAQNYAAHRNQGTPQTVSRIRHENFQPGEIEEFEGPNGKTWYKFKRQLTAEDYSEE